MLKNCLLILFVTMFSYSQVNTEKLRSDQIKNSFENQFGVELDYHSGNSKIFDLAIKYRLDYYTASYSYFLVSNLKRGVENKNTYLSNGFVHLRGTKHLSETFGLELFTQVQYNEFIKLDLRELIGMGTRKKLQFSKENSLTFGVGLMYEMERNEGGEEFHLMRSTNYVVTRTTINPSIQFLSTSYYQVNVSDLKDFRILCESKVSLAINSSLALETIINARYDHEPPKGVKQLDLSISNGITWSF